MQNLLKSILAKRNIILCKHFCKNRQLTTAFWLIDLSVDHYIFLTLWIHGKMPISIEIVGKMFVSTNNLRKCPLLQESSEKCLFPRKFIGKMSLSKKSYNTMSYRENIKKITTPWKRRVEEGGLGLQILKSRYQTFHTCPAQSWPNVWPSTLWLHFGYTFSTLLGQQIRVEVINLSQIKWSIIGLKYRFDHPYKG